MAGAPGFPDLSKATVEREKHLAIVAMRHPARRKPKKKPDKCLALSFEGAFEANLQRGTLSPRKWEEETQR